MDTTVVAENEILRAYQLRVLRFVGIDRVDARVRHLLATGRLSAGSVVAGYTRLLRDLRVAPEPRASLRGRESNRETPTSRQQ